MAELKESDLVLCTVKSIVGTTIFVQIENNGEGSIITSEIAPGRIRNIREYVVPGKKIVCKILNIEKGNINLSLRRVLEKERKVIMDKYEKEKNAFSIIKSVVMEKANEIEKKIKEKSSLCDFLQACKSNNKLLEEYFSREEAEKICKILKEKKEKQVEIKKNFYLKSNAADGITKIKKILMPYKEDITYLSAGKFMIKFSAEDYKKANSKSQKILVEICDKAKKEKAEFSEK